MFAPAQDLTNATPGHATRSATLDGSKWDRLHHGGIIPTANGIVFMRHGSTPEHRNRLYRGMTAKFGECEAIVAEGCFGARESRRRSESRQRSASRGRNASRRRTPSQRGEKITWTEVAKGASSGKTPSVTQRQAIEIIKANNEKIHAKLKEHDEMIKRINEKLAILLEALVASKPPESQEPRREPTPPNEPREEKREVVTMEEAARSSTDGDNGRPTEPSHKKRVVENTKERRLQARLDRMDEEREQLARTMNEKFNKLDERLTSVEQSMQGIQNGMVQLQAQIQSVMQNVERQKPEKDLLIWHWNCNGFAGKKETIIQHLKHAERKPDVIMLQETLSAETPKLPGYRTHATAAKVPSGNSERKKGGRRPGLAFVEHELATGEWTDNCAVEVITGKKARQSTLVVNVYSSPMRRKKSFRTLIQKAEMQLGFPELGLASSEEDPSQGI
ncbi:hypothetical protein HPB48_011997 [Haemaphysalis longicornis]|uniref:Endonuclease/exonuclease/phosphatase domain-containing protein n=1 Tax=Haemaphysalis longicornis TaxID=44386 RepID=A0A9J6H5I1_HAELO|nr:hypothetical protein HPB48_011997 [Haemaphysalis longicornis]